MRKFIRSRRKALMVVVGYGLSELANHGFDLRTPSGWGALATAIATAILVERVPNKGV